MKCIFCHHSHCLVNVHYCFLRNLERKLSKSPSNSPSNVRFRMYSKYIEKVYGTLSKHDRRPIPLCVTELVRSLCLDKRGRYNGFRYSDGTTINQLEECQLKEGEEVFHIQVVLSDIDVERFVERSPLAVAWETRNANEQPHKKNLISALIPLIFLYKQCVIVMTIFLQLSGLSPTRFRSNRAKMMQN